MAETIESNGKRAMFTPSLEMNLLMGLLSKCEPGDIVTWDQMQSACGVNCRPGRAGYGKLGSVKRRLEADLGFVFSTVPRVGVKRCLENEKPDVMAAVSDHIHRAARRGMKVAATVDLSKLDNADKIKFNTRASQLGALSAFTSAKVIKRLETAVTKAEAELPLTKALESTLEAFK